MEDRDSRFFRHRLAVAPITQGRWVRFGQSEAFGGIAPITQGRWVRFGQSEAFGGGCIGVVGPLADVEAAEQRENPPCASPPPGNDSLRVCYKQPDLHNSE
ncbi:unnamed protein product [Pleuronectes platessa]|uniref:Uncharacterized protein n=1 Tax=Pleuronectes platessa TaxID=8262 RepID=A0A9N7V8V4_PLEPL|nr:unnamed protein product [Pleuronectes platessa]